MSTARRELHVIGTAGHVDHGKTLLIEALTGINADRLPEEKRRGLTIDLGFAHFLGPEGRAIGVIDVPGHERFIRNMVAGAWSLDLALLTVAADDGWMQQSSDHTRVLALMGVPRLIGVITKADLANSERINRVGEQVAAECRRLGYPRVPVVAVSARSGQGVGELKALILSELAEPEPREREPGERHPTGWGVPYLYVDRAFTVKGSGLVVTGSLKGGELRRGQELFLLPQHRSTRVRGLQTYHEEVERAVPTCRVAINLAGAEPGGIARGDLLCGGKGSFRDVREFILRWTAPGEETPQLPRRDTEVEIAAGTAHRIAGLIPLPGSRLLRVRLGEAAALRWNQPAVLIRHGGSTILGGGRVLWLGKTTRQQRVRLSEIESSLGIDLVAGDLGRLKLALEGAIPPEEAERLALSPEHRGGTVEIGGWIAAKEYRDRLAKRIGELAGAPGGVRADELGSKLRGEPVALLRLLSGGLVEAGALSLRGGVLFPAGEQEPQVSPMGRQLLRDLQSGGDRGLELGKLKVAGARKELRNLVRAGLAVALEGDIYYEKGVYLDLVRRCLAGFPVGSTFAIALAKERTGLSRKYVIPLLNRMERDGFVKRSGDERVVTGLPE